MRRLVFCALAVVCAVFTGFALATDPHATLRGFQCVISRDPPGRSIGVTSVMKPLAGTMHMAVRFNLLERPKGGGPLEAVVYGDLDKWIYPKNKTLGQRPGDRFIVKKTVSGVDVAPAYYHYKVDFKWIGSHDRVIGRTTRYTPKCFQPELRPDLVVASIKVTPSTAHPNKDWYAAVIRNRGLSGAGPFEVEFWNGSNVDPRYRGLDWLGSHKSRTVRFLGPLCQPAAPPTVTVDPSDQVDDYNRSNNGLAATCPGS